MKNLIVRCQTCGAGLPVDEDCRYVTCSGCGAELEIVHNGPAVFSKVAKAGSAVVNPHASAHPPSAKTGQVLADVQRQNALLRLDHDWESYRRDMLNGRNRSGTYEPTTGTAILAGAPFFIVAGVAALSGSFPIPAVLIFGILGTVMIVLGLKRAERFSQRRRQYIQDRERVMSAHWK